MTAPPSTVTSPTHGDGAPATHRCGGPVRDEGTTGAPPGGLHAGQLASLGDVGQLQRHDGLPHLLALVRLGRAPHPLQASLLMTLSAEMTVRAATTSHTAGVGRAEPGAPENRGQRAADGIGRSESSHSGVWHREEHPGWQLTGPSHCHMPRLFHGV